MNKNILHCVGSLATSSGGPARTVTALTDSIAFENLCSVTLLSQRHSGEEVFLADKKSRVDRQIVDSSSTLAMVLGWPIKRMLSSTVRTNMPALLHDHGIWMPSNHHVAAAARRFAIPLVIHPRGMLEPWAVNHKAWKKRLALFLYQRRDLETATLFIATAEQEAESIRRLRFRQPIAIIPNGVAVVELDSDKELKKGQRETRTVLFLSRIHPKKGLLNLIEAWGKVRPVDWCLKIAGPDEGGHLAEVMRCVQSNNLEASVDYVGEVEGQEKRDLYLSADLFVLPTFSENFGVVVAEALAHGLPVITTRGTPWSDLETYKCGWWIDIGVDPLVDALNEAMSLNDNERLDMGMRGREYVQRYSWGSIAQQTIDVYRWVLGQGSKPDCIRMD